MFREEKIDKTTIIFIFCTIFFIIFLRNYDLYLKEKTINAMGQEVLKEKQSIEFTSISYESYQQWEELISNYTYHISQHPIKVPKLKVIKFPNNLNQIRDIHKKKKLFFSIVLIGAYHANQEILEIRSRLDNLDKKYSIKQVLTVKEEKWINQLKEKYNIDSRNLTNTLDKLQQRVDVIPLSLLLAQAACESGWGTSRFTIEANNIFGEWTFSEDVAGVIPEDRPAGAQYKIKKFESIEDSINSYINNLNSNIAYKKLWSIRKALRKNNQKLNSLKLSKGILKYSQRREEYIEEIQAIIEYNNLQELDYLIEY